MEEPRLRRLYFAHSYSPEQRRFNESIWRVLMDLGFVAWIDAGLEEGTDGRRYPMDVSFNEWMMSRCDGFIAVLPPVRSRYLDLEERLALRMGLPTLVLATEGARSSTYEFPRSWRLFLSRDVTTAIAEHAKAFAASVEAARDLRFSKTPASRRLRARTGGPSIALLPPVGSAKAWADAHDAIASECTATLLNPANFRQPRDLIVELDEHFDLLVVDVGEHGTPREMLGYLEAHGVPLVRVCFVPSPGMPFSMLERGVRQPYRATSEDTESATAQAGLPSVDVSSVVDGLQIDDKMRPVLFWGSATELSGRILGLVRRIAHYRLGFDETQKASRVDLVTHQQARDYFAPPPGANWVFLSFAGKANDAKATEEKRTLADKLSKIFRFHDVRCFHYLDEDSGIDGRLESGEPIDAGLDKRVEEADVVVVLYDAAYTQSAWCKEELRQAIALRKGGRVRVRAYRLSSGPPPVPEFDGLNVYEHRGKWKDTKLENLIVKDVLEDCKNVSAALRELDEVRVKEWLADDGRTEGKQVREILAQSGVSATELDGLEISENASAASFLEQLFELPREKPTRRRRRALVTLLLTGLATVNAERRRVVNRWVRERALVGSLPRTEITFEQVVEVRNSVAPVNSTQDPAVLGERIGHELSAVLQGTKGLVLQAGTRPLEIPVEWARENAATEAVCLRRRMRWRLAEVDVRNPIIEELSTAVLPPKWLLLALEGDHINPEAEVSQLKQTLTDLYVEHEWPPEFIKVAVCKGKEDVAARLRGTSNEIVHIAGHMGGDSLQVASEEIPSSVVAQWFVDSNVRMVLLNGCSGAHPTSPLALHRISLADSIVRLGKVPEVVAHRLPLNEADGIAFANAFCRSFTETFDADEACFVARKVGSKELELLPVLISQRGVRTG